MSLGKQILNLRKKQGLSQEQLGEKINVSRQTISNWELGETSPNPAQLKSLSKILKVSIDDLLENDVEFVLGKKVNNVEKILKSVLKFLGIFLIVLLVIDVISLIIFILYKFL